MLASHGTLVPSQPFVERLAPRAGPFAVDFVAGFGFGLAAVFLEDAAFLAAVFVPREGPGLAFFVGVGEPDFLRAFGRRRSISAINPRRASWTPSATRRLLSEI